MPQKPQGQITTPYWNCADYPRTPFNSNRNSFVDSRRTSPPESPTPTITEFSSVTLKMSSASSASNAPDAAAQRFTDQVVSGNGPGANPRIAQIVASLVRHLHAFAREVELTSDEWMLGVDFLNQAGAMSNQRNEMQLIGDILGFESLVDEITSRAATAAASAKSNGPAAATSSAILGPFYKPDAPARNNGESIACAATNAKYAAHTAHVTGRVLSATTGQPVAHATVDIWHATPTGEYEGQDATQGSGGLSTGDLRGVYTADEHGRFDIYCLRPGSYPLPLDGPVGKLLALLDRPEWRPGHLHFWVSAPGFRELTTQVFDAEDEHCADDVVFAVKDDLKVTWKEAANDPMAKLCVEFDFRLSEC